MSEIKWGLIQDDKEFESLVFCLLRFKDVQVRVYERPGRDASIDAKSGDGRTVYQAKYIRNSENFSSVITQSTKELEKIKKYREPQHNNYQHWKDVKKWCLITNATWNSTDETKWNNSVKEPFQEINLEVEIQHKQIIEDDLKKYPNVKKEYFDGENRIFQSLPEFIETVKHNIILSKGFNPELIEGRREELKNFSEFIQSDKKIICIHGPGGIGKTRFAIETAYQTNQKGYDIFWANTATLEKNNNWFQSINSSRKALLVIDEPKEQNSIEILLEQVRHSAISNWKFVIVTRTSKDHILDPLKPVKIVYEPIEIKPLDEPSSRKIIQNLIENSLKLKGIPERSKLVSNYLWKVSEGFPIYIAMGIHLEESESIEDLSGNKFGLKQMYLDEILSQHPPSVEKRKFIKYIKAIVLLQPINIEDDPQLKNHFNTLITDSEPSELEDVFNTLQEKKFAFKRGRLLEIKPDVIRDYIIYKRIGNNTSESKEWLQRILNLQNLNRMKSALVQLAKLALYQKHQQKKNVTFFDAIWDIFINKIKTGSPDTRFNTFEAASSISFSNLPRFLELVSSIREIHNHSMQNQETTDSNNYITSDHLVLQLPQAVYSASNYISSEEEADSVFKELLNLSHTESKLIDANGKYHYMQNDGNRTTQLIPSLMQRSNFQFQLYEKILFQWTIDQLDNLDKIQFNLLEILIKEFFKTFTLTHFLISSDSKEQKNRNNIYKKICNLIEERKVKNIQQRTALWKLIGEHLRQSNDAERKDGKSKYWEKEVEDTFEFLKKYISNNNIEMSEIKCLTDMWKWNLKYDKREKFKTLAKDCESLIEQHNPLYNDIEPLLDFERFSQQDTMYEKLSQKLDSKNKIHSLIKNLFQYYGKSESMIYNRLAPHFLKESKLLPHVQEYVDDIIHKKTHDHHFQCVAIFISYQFNHLRKNNRIKQLFQLLNSYWNKLETTKQKEEFLIPVFGHLHPKSFGTPSNEDIKFISQILESELSNVCLNIVSHFLGNIIFSHFEKSKKLICYIFKKIEPQNARSIFHCFVKGVGYRTVFKDSHPFTAKRNMFLWIMNLLEYVPDIDLHLTYDYEMNQIMRALNTKLSVVDYINILRKRIKIIENKNDPSWKNIFLNDDFFKIVDKVEKTDFNSQEVKDALEKLLNFNNHNSLHFFLPNLASKLDPEGILIPTMICEKIQKKIFLCKKSEDIPPECEWTRYAGYYPTNSKPWRIIAKTACDIAENKIKEGKTRIFSSLLDHRIQSFKSTPGQVAPHFYNKVRNSELDSQNEKDLNIKKFMEWKLKGAVYQLEREKKRQEEQEII